MTALSVADPTSSSAPISSPAAETKAGGKCTPAPPATNSRNVVRAARKKKGGAPEGARQEENQMSNVVQARPASNRQQPVTAGFHVESARKKLGSWLDDLIASAKSGPIAKVIQLTPELAELLLDRNPANRKLSEQTAERYSYEIAGGRWTFNGEPLIVSDTGELNDGQHRCAAVIRAKRAIDAILIVGVARASRTTLDQGRTRTAADYLSMDGHVNTAVLAAAANYAWQYRNRGMLVQGGANRATKSEVMNFIADNPGLKRSVAIHHAMKKSRLGGHAFLSFCHFAVGSVGKAEDVDQFFIALSEGVNLGVGSPVLYARNRIMGLSGARDMNAKAELIFKAWNAWRRGERVEKIWLSGGVLPVLEA